MTKVQKLEQFDAILKDISRLSSYPICIQQWRVLGQHDAINVFDLEPWREELRRLRSNSDLWEVNCQALYKALEAAEVKFPKLVA